MFRWLKNKEKNYIEIKCVNNLENLIRDHNYTYYDVANMVGSSYETIFQIANNGFVPSVYLALCLATLFECKVEDIFYLNFIGGKY